MITLYGRTYWDVEIDVSLASIGEGKGKVDTQVSMTIGGFACNAARAICSLFPSGSVRIVTLASPLDERRLRSSLPAEIELVAMCSDDRRLDWPAATVVINPSAECRILRDPMEHTDDLWQVDQVSDKALASDLHVLGRLPAHFVAGVLERAHAREAKVAWCGGHALSQDIEKQFDFLCINSAEAVRLLDTDDQSPRESAEALVHRASVPGAVRLVTGRGAAPTAVAFRDGDALRCHETPREQLAPEHIKTLFRVGDVFAANFLALASVGDVDVAGALDAAHKVATRFIKGEDLTNVQNSSGPIPS